MPKIPLFRKKKFGRTATYKDIKEPENNSFSTDQEVVKFWNEEHSISDEDCKLNKPSLLNALKHLKEIYDTQQIPHQPKPWYPSPHVLMQSAKELRWSVTLGTKVISPLLGEFYSRRTMKTAFVLPNGQVAYPSAGMLPSKIVVEECCYHPDDPDGITVKESLEYFYFALGKLFEEQLAIATQVTSESIARTALSWVPGTPLTEQHVLGSSLEAVDGVVIFLCLFICQPHHEGSVVLVWEDDFPNKKIEDTASYQHGLWLTAIGLPDPINSKNLRSKR
ncbi:unnamed protein product [Fusarium equiseti]|uniref:Uncharacterized protein n=1 Tax=Fusarium equiseti TaxID=61235 RepID=A0A8J2IL28_FUSEQ|nr:unnamed protein product [Fusarium equiseti]